MVLDATSTIQQVVSQFQGIGALIVQYALPLGLTLFGGIVLYFWAKGFLKKHLHG